MIRPATPLGTGRRRAPAPARTLPSSSVLFARLVSRTRLRNLLLVARIAELESLQAAADSIALSQPAATHALAELEAILGARLFERHSRGMRPTELGQELLAHIRRALASIQNCADAAVSSAMGVSSTVRVGAIGAAQSGMLIDVLTPFSEAHPNVVIEVIPAVVDDMLRALADAELDLLLCREPLPMPAGMAFVPLVKDRYAVLARPGHRLAALPRVSLSQLSQETWLQAPPRGLAARDFEHLCEALGMVPRFCWISSKPVLTALALLQQRDLVTYIPRNTARQLIDNGLLVELKVPRVFRGDLPPVGLLTSHGHARAPAVALFVDFLLAHHPDGSPHRPD